MKVELIEKGLLIVPETEFESDYIRHHGISEAHKSYGMTPGDLVGIEIHLDPKNP